MKNSKALLIAGLMYFILAIFSEVVCFQICGAIFTSAGFICETVEELSKKK